MDGDFVKLLKCLLPDDVQLRSLKDFQFSAPSNSDHKVTMASNEFKLCGYTCPQCGRLDPENLSVSKN